MITENWQDSAFLIAHQVAKQLVQEKKLEERSVDTFVHAVLYTSPEILSVFQKINVGKLLDSRINIRKYDATSGLEAIKAQYNNCVAANEQRLGKEGEPHEKPLGLTVAEFDAIYEEALVNLHRAMKLANLATPSAGASQYAVAAR